MINFSSTYKNSRFELTAGEIDETNPSITDGLVAYFPFDGNSTGVNPSTNIIDPTSIWVLDTYGSQGYYIMNGEPSANKIMLKNNPWDVSAAVWATELNDLASDQDGGWNVTGKIIDKTKRYRFSVWIRRENMGDGNTYFGVQQNTVWDLGTTTLNNNPYASIWTPSQWSGYTDQWLLWVFHVHDSSYAGSSFAISGIYTKAGVRVGSATDFKWANTTTVSGHRSYLYYSTSTTERQYWYEPRMEINDSTSSTITDLLVNYPAALYPSVETNTVSSYKEGLGITTNTVNLLPYIQLTWGPWGGLIGTSNQYTNFYGRNGVHIDISTGGGVQYYYTSGANVAVSPSTIYTVSAMVKIPKGIPSLNLFYIREYLPNGVQKKEFGLFNIANTTYTQSDWYKARGTFTTDASTTQLSITGYEYTAGVEVYIEDIQLEQKPYYTSYVVGTRSAAGTVNYPIQGGLTTYTIFGRIIPHTALYNAYTSTADQSLLFTIQDNASTGDAQWRYYAPTSSVPFIELSGSFGSTNNHATYDISSNIPAYYVVKKTGTSLTCKFNQGGNWKAQHNATLANNTQLSNFILGGANPIWNVDHTDLMIYNRVLADSELDLIIKEKEVYRSNGDLGCYINEDINPNLWPNPDLSTTSYIVSAGGATTLKTDSYGTYHDISVNTTNSTYRGYDIVTDAGSTYIFSGWFWIPSGFTFNYGALVIEGATSASGVVYCSGLLKDQWVYAEESCVSDGNIRCLIYPNAGAGTYSGYIKFRGICVKKLSSNDIKLNGYGELEVGDFSE